MTDQARPLGDFETRLTARVDMVDATVTALALQLQELRGFAKGSAIAIPIAIAIAVVTAGLNYWLLRSGLPPR